MDIKVQRFREAASKTVKLLAGQGVEVRFEGATPKVAFDSDGKPTRLTLPAIPDGAPRELLDAVQGYIDHEVAHMFYTDAAAERSWTEQLISDGVAQDNKNSREITHTFANLVEDIRIEKLMARDYRGSGANLSKAREFLATELPEIFDKCMAQAMLGKASPPEPTLFYLPAYIRSLAGQPEFNELLESQEGLKESYAGLHKALPNLEEDLKSLETFDDSLALARKFLEIMDPPQDGQGDGDGDEDNENQDGQGGQGGKSGRNESDGDDQGDGDQEGQGQDGNSDGDQEGQGQDGDGDQEGQGQDGNSDGDQEGQGQDGDGDGQDGDGGKGQSNPSGNQDDGDNDFEAQDSVGGAPGLGSKTGALPTPKGPMDMMDFDGAMETVIGDRTIDAFQNAEGPIDFATYFDFDVHLPIDKLKEKNLIDVAGTEDKVRQVSAAMQKELQRLIAARSLTVRAPGFRRGKLHGPSLHRLTRGDDRVFYRKQENKSNDVAVSLLIDCSGSMSGDRIRTAGQAAWAFAEVLERIGVSCEVNGFMTESYYDELHYGDDIRQRVDRAREFADEIGVSYGRVRAEGSLTIPFKTFDERFGRKAKERLAVTQGRGMSGFMSANCDYVAVRQALYRLAQRRESRKILFVFSDGYPACSMDHRVGYKALKDTVASSEQFGIETIGIGINSESVEEFYPKHAIIEDVADLPEVTLTHLRKLLVAS